MILPNLPNLNCPVSVVYSNLHEIFLDAGIDTLEKLVKSSPDELFEKLLAVNKEKGYTKIMATLKDVALCIKIAKELPKVVEY